MVLTGNFRKFKLFNEISLHICVDFFLGHSVEWIKTNFVALSYYGLLVGDKSNSGTICTLLIKALMPITFSSLRVQPEVVIVLVSDESP